MAEGDIKMNEKKNHCCFCGGTENIVTVQRNPQGELMTVCRRGDHLTEGKGVIRAIDAHTGLPVEIT